MQQSMFTWHLKLKELRLGYLLKFGAPLMKDGLKRIINGLEDNNLGVFGSLREPKSKRRSHGESVRVDNPSNIQE